MVRLESIAIFFKRTDSYGDLNAPFGLGTVIVCGSLIMTRSLTHRILSSKSRLPSLRASPLSSELTAVFRLRTRLMACGIKPGIFGYF